MRRTTFLSMGIPKARVICCAIRGHPQLGFRCFMPTTAAMTSWLGPLGPGFIGSVDEKSRRYFRWISARCRLNSVDGLKTIAERIKRPGRTKIAHRRILPRSRHGQRMLTNFGIRHAQAEKATLAAFCGSLREIAGSKTPPNENRSVFAFAPCRALRAFAARCCTQRARKGQHMKNNQARSSFGDFHAQHDRHAFILQAMAS